MASALMVLAPSLVPSTSARIIHMQSASRLVIIVARMFMCPGAKSSIAVRRCFHAALVTERVKEPLPRLQALTFLLLLPV